MTFGEVFTVNNAANVLGEAAFAGSSLPQKSLFDEVRKDDPALAEEMLDACLALVRGANA